VRHLLCTCQGCGKAGDLRLKFVAHAGEVAEQKVKRWREIAGVDVIMVHRMLKNQVPVPEYLLMTEPVYGPGEPVWRSAQSIEHEFDDLGRVPTYFVDLDAWRDAPAAAPECAPALALRIWEQLKLTLRTLPMLVGLRRPSPDFRNLATTRALPPAS
jgi:hypothetical protein